MKVNIISINKNLIRLKLETSTLEFPLNHGVYVDGRIDQAPPLRYIISKCFKRVAEKENILIRYNNPLNIIRVVELPELGEDEIKSYIDLNIDSLLPGEYRDYPYEYMYDGKYLVLAIMDMDLIDIIDDFSEGYPHVFLTNFPIEVLANYKGLSAEDFIYFNIEDSFIEYIIFKSGEFVNYKYENLLNEIDKEGFDVKDSDNKLIVHEILSKINDIIYSNGLSNETPIYSIGDKSIVEIYNQVLKDTQITYREMPIERYFK